MGKTAEEIAKDLRSIDYAIREITETTSKLTLNGPKCFSYTIAFAGVECLAEYMNTIAQQKEADSVTIMSGVRIALRESGTPLAEAIAESINSFCQPSSDILDEADSLVKRYLSNNLNDNPVAEPTGSFGYRELNESEKSLTASDWEKIHDGFNAMVRSSDSFERRSPDEMSDAFWIFRHGWSCSMLAASQTESHAEKPNLKPEVEMLKGVAFALEMPDVWRATMPEKLRAIISGIVTSLEGKSQ